MRKEDLFAKIVNEWYLKHCHPVISVSTAQRNSQSFTAIIFLLSSVYN